MTRALKLGVLVPCRNEANVIERKLANLALVAWPTAPPRGPGDDARDAAQDAAEHGCLHVIVIVDDGSEDGTPDRAREAIARHFAGQDSGAPRAELIRNDRDPGKAGALRAGLAALEGRVDLIVLTDADVVLEELALVELARAFAAEPGLGMASGEQHFVRALDPGGSPAGPGGAEAEPADGLFDRITARVRHWESDRGMLFSVHGQLLAWRAGLGLEPRTGIAADDIDLALQARERGATVRLVARARFLEQKTPPGPVAEAQALRRARAYVQVMRRVSPPTRGGLTVRLQWWFYRYVPLAAPALALAGALAGLILSFLWGGAVPGFLALVLVGVLASVGAGRRLLRLLAVIRRAAQLERREALADRWEMGRP